MRRYPHAKRLIRETCLTLGAADPRCRSPRRYVGSAARTTEEGLWGRLRDCQYHLLSLRCGMWLAAAARLLICSGLTAAAMWWWLRARHRGGSASLFGAADEQSPNGQLIVEADSLCIVDANAALQQSAGYALADLCAITLPQLLEIERNDTDTLARLRDPDPRVPLRLRLRARSGETSDVEAIGHRLQRGSQGLLAFTLCDVTLRRRVEEQLLEKQRAPQTTSRITISSRDCRTGCIWRITCPGRSRRPRAAAACWRCCFWIWTASSTSTTHAAMRPATSC